MSRIADQTLDPPPPKQPSLNSDSIRLVPTYPFPKKTPPPKKKISQDNLKKTRLNLYVFKNFKILNMRMKKNIEIFYN